MIKYSYSIISFILFQLNLSCYATDILATRLTLSLHNESLKDLTKDILSKTNYTLIFPENFYQMKIDGQYHDVTLNQLLTKILKGISHSLVIDEEKRLIIVYLFKTAVTSNVQKGFNDTKEDSSDLPSEYYDELVRIAQKNEADFQRFISNPDSLDPISGLTFKEISNRAISAQSAVKAFVDNNNSIDPFSGKSIGTLKKISHANSEKSEDYMSKKDATDPLSGKNIHELRQQALKQESKLGRLTIEMLK